MNSSRGRRQHADAVVRSTSRTSPELQRLADAQAALDHARRNAKWKRECKNLQSASHAVQVAALAAHDAGISWAEIGDVLGIERAMPQPTPTPVTPLPLPEPELEPVLPRTLQHFPEPRQWVAG